MIEATELIGVRLSSDGKCLRLRVRDQNGQTVSCSVADMLAEHDAERLAADRRMPTRCTRWTVGAWIGSATVRIWS